MKSELRKMREERRKTMFHKTTEDLLESLRGSGQLREALAGGEGEFIAQPLHEALAALLTEKGLTRNQVIRDSQLNVIYGYQIFSGTKTPSRDKLLALAFGMRLTFEETDRLLKQQGYPRLYPRRARDAVLIYGLMHRLALLDVNTLLYENELETLL